MTTQNVVNANGETFAQIRRCTFCGRLFGKGQRQEYRKHLRDHVAMVHCQLCNAAIRRCDAHNLPFVTDKGEHWKKLVCTTCFGIGAKTIDDWAKRKPGGLLG